MRLLCLLLMLLGPPSGASAQDGAAVPPVPPPQQATDPQPAAGAPLPAPQDAVPAPVIVGLGTDASADAISKRLEELAAIQGTDPDLVALWEQALAAARSRDSWRAQAAEHLRLKATHADSTAAIQAELAAPPPPLPSPAADLPDEALEGLLTDARTQLELAHAKVKEHATERARRSTRRTEITVQLSAARDRLAALGTVSADAAVGAMGEANFVVNQTQREAAESEIASHEAERSRYESANPLLALREDLAARRVLEAQAAVDRLAALVSDRRKQSREAALQEAEDSRAELADAHPMVRDLAAKNVELVSETNAREEAREGLLKRLSDAQVELKALIDRRDRVFARVDRVGFTPAVASLLRRERASLPEMAKVRAELSVRQEDISDAETRLLELEDERTELATPQLVVDTMLSGVTDVDDVELLGANLLAELTRRRDLVDEAWESAARTYDMMLDLDDAQRTRVNVSSEYADYIDQKVTWVRSSRVLGFDDIVLALGGFRLAGARSAWLESLAAAAALPWERRSPMRFATALLVLGLLLSRPALRAALRRQADAVRSERIPAIGHTLKAALLTVLLAVGWPLLLLTLAEAFSQVPTVLAEHLGASMMSLSVLILPLTLLQSSVLKDGLGEAHLRWPTTSTRRVRFHLRWLAPVMVPSTFAALIFERLEPDPAAVAAGRLALITMTGSMAVAMWTLLRPGSPVIRDLARRHGRGLLLRTQPLWFPLALALPVLLALGAVLGYQYTAFRLSIELHDSWGLVLTLVLSHGIALRWLGNEHRRALLEQARRRRQAASESEPTSAESEEALPLDDAPDVSLINAQARSLLTAVMTVAVLFGLWGIWSDLLPAFGALREVDLWSVSDTVMNAKSGEAVAGLRVVSLADVFAAVAIFLLTLSATRNVPGLLDVAVLRRLPIQASSAYAAATFARYAIFLLGTSLTLGALGVTWANIQWLVAAVGLGLGFGLQEIFANFISGLILLVERRIRVGDLISMDDVSGVVARVRVLATHVRDFDEKELVVPNTQLITTRVLNWTLSDNLTRTLVKVGVAYGTDTTLARALMEQVARDHPAVLDQPQPFATFDAFGDSTLNLTLRAWLPQIAQRWQVTSELHELVDRAFKQAGIEIAFPQRDLHVRNWPPDPAEPRPERPRPAVPPASTSTVTAPTKVKPSEESPRSGRSTRDASGEGR